jgi:hypothetical protein
MLQVIAQSVVLPVALRRTFGLFFLEKRRAELIDGCLQNKNKTQTNQAQTFSVEFTLHCDQQLRSSGENVPFLMPAIFSRPVEYDGGGQMVLTFSGMKKETKKSNWRVPVTLLVSIKGRPLEITSAGRPYLFEIYYKERGENE